MATANRSRNPVHDI